MNAQRVDCLIVGGGPGGLTAATYLARFQRSVAVVDGGESRLGLIPLSRNIPGFPEGISGPALQARMLAQAATYGAQLIEGRVTSCQTDVDGFAIRSTAGTFSARTLLLATGVDVTSPEMADLADAIARGVVRYCPICDGFEATGMRIGVLGGRPGSIEEAHFRRTYSADVTYVPAQDAAPLRDDQIARAERAGIRIEHRSFIHLSVQGNALVAGHALGAASVFDVVYPCLGSVPRSELAVSLRAGVSEDGELLTDAHQATNVAGLYAVGDVLRGLDQVASACGQAAIAATAIHNWLRQEDERSAAQSAPLLSSTGQVRAD